jgi:hypothetical protein
VRIVFPATAGFFFWSAGFVGCQAGFPGGCPVYRRIQPKKTARPVKGAPFCFVP